MIIEIIIGIFNFLYYSTGYLLLVIGGFFYDYSLRGKLATRGIRVLI